MCNIPNSRRDFHAMTVNELRSVYSRCRMAVCARDTISPAEFDEDMRNSASNLYGWMEAPAMASAALCDYLSGFTSNHHQITAETLEWGGGLSGVGFSTTERHAEGFRLL